MMKLTVKAYAKLNLTLDIQGLLPNGYHSIESVFQSISLHDVITLESGMDDISVTCSNPDIPQGKDNICYNAVKLFFQQAGVYDGVSLHIEKNIPEAAGMGGGSADAAATLIALNRIYRHILDEGSLRAIAAKLGADVPFCMLGGACLATGTGEILKPIGSLPDCDIVLIKQGKKPSTAELYRRFDEHGTSCHPDTAAEILALQKGDLTTAAEHVSNCFAPIWGPGIAKVKSDMLDLGALAAELTGSGPTVFGIFRKGAGSDAMEALKNIYSDVHICHPSVAGVEILSKDWSQNE